MAIKTKSKKSAPRATKISKSRQLQSAKEIVEWMTEDETQFQLQISRHLNRLNQEGSVKEFRKFANLIVKDVGTFSKNEIEKFNKIPDRYVTQTLCSLGALYVNAGMPITEWIKGHVQRFVSHALDMGYTQETPEIKKESPQRPSIQDYMAERTNELIGELEGEYDLVIMNKKLTIKPLEFFKDNKVIITQLKKYSDVFESRKEELSYAFSLKKKKEALDEDEKQVVESYRHYKDADYKRLLGWIDSLLDSIEQYKVANKSTVVRRISPAVLAKRNATKASKVKYLKTDPTYNLTSVSPLSILGAQEVWVFNVKTRKLGKYVAQDYQTLDLSGTTIKNYNTNKSICKTLRKPQEQLKEFNKAGKVALRTFLDGIKSTETKLNGRINEDTILLKIQ